MRAFYVALIASILSSVWADIAWNDAELNKSVSIFPYQKSTQSIDNRILKSLETTTNLFHDYTESKAIQAITMGAQYVPFLGTVTELAAGLADLFAKESKWQDEFSKVLNRQLKENKAEASVYDMGNQLKYIQDHIPFINETIANKTNVKNDLTEDEFDEIRGDVQNIKAFLEIMVNSFERHDSYFRDSPLIGAPVLIEIGLIIAAFEPIAVQFLREASKNQLSCRMRDTMLDYLPVMTTARLDKVHMNFKRMIGVRNEPYNPNGYHFTDNLNCEKMSQSKTEKCTEFYSHRYSKKPAMYCLVDDSSTLQLYKYRNVNNCELSYARHLRTLVQKMFPIETLKKVCGKEPKETTGSGWARIRLRGLYVELSRNQKTPESPMMNCDYNKLSKCDPYVRVTIYGKDETQVERTDVKWDTESYDVGETIKSGLIQKSTSIKIEIFDADGSDADPEKDEISLLLNGTIDYFMKNPYHCFFTQMNCIEVDVIWQDERKR